MKLQSATTASWKTGRKEEIMWREEAAILRPTLTDDLFWQNGFFWLGLKAYLGLWTEESPRYQSYCEIFSLRTASMAGAHLSRQFTRPKPLTSHFIISVCAQRHTRPSRQNLQCCLHGVWFMEGAQVVCPGGVIRQHRSSAGAWCY